MDGKWVVLDRVIQGQMFLPLKASDLKNCPSLYVGPETMRTAHWATRLYGTMESDLYNIGTIRYGFGVVDHVLITLQHT